MDEDQVRAIVRDEIAKIVGPPLAGLIDSMFSDLTSLGGTFLASQITNLGDALGGE
jgi:hypothetical protein